MLISQRHFFICYFTSPQPTLDHYQGSRLIHLMLITVFLSIFDPKISRRFIPSPSLGAPNSSPCIASSMRVGVLGHFWPKNHTRKINSIHKILKYTRSSCIIFYIKISQYSRYIYCLQKESTHFGVKVLTDFGLEVTNSVA